jgi:hypothetical protein
MCVMMDAATYQSNLPHHVKNKTCHVSIVKLVFGFDDPSLISKVR